MHHKLKSSIRNCSKKIDFRWAQQMFGIGGSTGSLNFPMSYDYGSDYGATSGEGKRGWSFLEKLLCAFLVIFVLVASGLIAAVIVLGLQLRGSTPLTSGISTKKLCDTQECVTVASDILRAMDPEVSPCDDFYKFACGGWAKQHPLPVTSNQWGQFEILRERMGQQVRDILEEEIPESLVFNKTVTEAPFPFQLAEEFYETCLDQDNANAEDNSELEELLDNLIGNSDTFSFLNITNVLADIRRKLAGNYIFSMIVDLDERNTTNNVIYLDQPVFALPRQYLVDVDAGRENPMRQAYVKFIEAIWKILFPEDVTRAATIARDILRIETALALISASAEERRNITTMYNPVSFQQLVNLTSVYPFIDWSTYFNEVFRDISGDFNDSVVVMHNESHTVTGVFDDGHYVYETMVFNDSKTLDFKNMTYIVQDVKFFQELGTALDLRYNQRDVLNFLKWRIIFDYGAEANARLRQVFYKFFQVTQGLPQPPQRWVMCAQKTNALFGMAVSYRYVQKYFPEERIKGATALVGDLRRVFRQTLTELDWLDSETRALALEKVAKMKEFIGFPKWLSDQTLLEEYYDGMDYFYAPDSHFLNTLQMAHWHYRKDLAKILEPKDPEEWSLDPTIVNALYDFSYNSINFPAGVLQNPFFNMPIQALNYGAIGVIIGHEITHGFDDRGHLSDADGNVKNWWRNTTRQNYLNKSECFVKQYSKFSANIENEVFQIDGRQTLGENIADNGGLRQAFEAYRLYVRRNGEEPSLPGLSNYTPEQLFFLSYAQIWCESSTPASFKQQILHGDHLPNKFRVKGAVANSHEFSETWKCQQPTRPCKIW